MPNLPNAEKASVSASQLGAFDLSQEGLGGRLVSLPLSGVRFLARGITALAFHIQAKRLEHLLDKYGGWTSSEDGAHRIPQYLHEAQALRKKTSSLFPGEKRLCAYTAYVNVKALGLCSDYRSALSVASEARSLLTSCDIGTTRLWCRLTNMMIRCQDRLSSSHEEIVERKAELSTEMVERISCLPKRRHASPELECYKLVSFLSLSEHCRGLGQTHDEFFYLTSAFDTANKLLERHGPATDIKIPTSSWIIDDSINPFFSETIPPQFVGTFGLFDAATGLVEHYLNIGDREKALSVTTTCAKFGQSSSRHSTGISTISKFARILTRIVKTSFRSRNDTSHAEDLEFLEQCSLDTACDMGRQIPRLELLAADVLVKKLREGDDAARYYAALRQKLVLATKYFGDGVLQNDHHPRITSCRNEVDLIESSTTQPDFRRHLKSCIALAIHLRERYGTASHNYVSKVIEISKIFSRVGRSDIALRVLRGLYGLIPNLDLSDRVHYCVSMARMYTQDSNNRAATGWYRKAIRLAASTGDLGWLTAEASQAGVDIPQRIKAVRVNPDTDTLDAERRKQMDPFQQLNLCRQRLSQHQQNQDPSGMLEELEILETTLEDFRHFFPPDGSSQNPDPEGWLAFCHYALGIGYEDLFLITNDRKYRCLAIRHLNVACDTFSGLGVTYASNLIDTQKRIEDILEDEGNSHALAECREARQLAQQQLDTAREICGEVDWSALFPTS